MKPASDIASRLLDLEATLDWTHRQLGDVAGRRVNAVSEWTLGKRVPPTSALERIAGHLELPISVFEEGGPMLSSLLSRPTGARSGLPPSSGGSAVRDLPQPPIPSGKTANGPLTPAPEIPLPPGPHSWGERVIVRVLAVTAKRILEREGPAGAGAARQLLARFFAELAEEFEVLGWGAEETKALAERLRQQGQ